MLCDQLYAKLIGDILATETKITTRNSTGWRVHSRMAEFTETPLIHARKTAWKNSLKEMAWFLSGSNKLADLHPSVHKWWEPWSVNGRVANNYSRQLRYFHGAEEDPETGELKVVTVDQVAGLIDGIKNHPFSRRNVITTWNTAEMAHPSTALTNCHGTIIQAFVNPEDNTLDLTTYQRSADVIVGLGSNWLQYYAFLVWLAHRTGRKVGKLTWIGGDVHIYGEHEEVARKILSVQSEVLKKAAFDGPLPKLVYTPTSDEFRADDFSLDREYEPVLLDRAEMVV